MEKREKLQKDMFAAHEKQKTLIKKRNLILNNRGKEDALKITHEIAQLEDFIRMAENTLKMSD